MSREIALVEHNVITNVIVIPADGDLPDLPEVGPPLDPQAYVDADGNPYQRAVDVSHMDPKPGIGWVFVKGRNYVPPVEISVDTDSIPPDGTTVATISYTDNRADPPAEVAADVNDEATTVALSNGRGKLTVASRSAGDQIVVRIGGAGVSIDVEDPDGPA